MEIFTKCEKFFVFFAIICAPALVFFLPPFTGADEPAHFARIYSLSQGKIMSQVVNNQAGNYVPAAIMDFERFWHPMIVDNKIKTNFEQIKKSVGFIADTNRQEFTNQCYQTLYSPIAYLPQTIGLSVANFFTDSVYFLLLSAKLFLLAFYIAAGYWAIKITPVYKWIFLLVLLMPTSLSLGASVSADGVVIPLSALFFAYVFKYSFDDELRIDKKAVFIFSLFTIALSLVKQSFLIALFLLFIPKNKFGSGWKTYLLKLSAIFLPGLSLALLWNMCCKGWFVPLNGSNPVVQLRFILEHPVTYLFTILKTIKLCFVMWLYMAIGVLGCNNVFLFPPVYVLYAVAFAVNIVFKTEQEKVYITSLQKSVFAFLILVNFIFIVTELYLSWTSPYFTKFVSFVQGRYLIPVLIPVLTLLGFIFVSPKERNSCVDIFTACVLTVAYLNTFLAIFVAYYF